MLTLLGGCQFFTPPFQQPIIEQHAQNRINTFGVIPSRRMMIVKNELPEGSPAAAAETKILICAEAPADVTDNLAATLAANLAVSGPIASLPEKTVNASGGIAQTLQTFGNNLFKRTQGIQLFRDRSYHLCQARMNGFIGDQEYKESINKLMDTVEKLILAELAQQQHQEPVNVVASGMGPAAASITEGGVTATVGPPVKPPAAAASAASAPK